MICRGYPCFIFFKQKTKHTHKKCIFRWLAMKFQKKHPTPGQLLGANSNQASELYASSLFKGEGPTYSQFQRTLMIWGY